MYGLERQARSVAFDEWWKSRQAFWHANWIGFSGSMDASGMLAIFQRSIENYSLSNVEFLGERESRESNSVYGDIEVTT